VIAKAIRMRTYIPAVLILASLPGIAQTLSPREIFYGQGRASDAKPAGARKKAPVAAAPAAVPEPEPKQPAPSAGPSYVPVKRVKDEPHPLALRYSIKKLDGGSSAEVDKDTTFHAGDQICLAIETNDSGYLYVVAQGSSGRWEVQYPTEAVSGSNSVERGKTYKIPPAPDEFLTFDSRAGDERLFVVLTRRPVPDLEKLIYSLQEGKPKEAGDKTMMAQNFSPINDDVVQGLRGTYSRDLVIQKVNDAKAVSQGDSQPAASVPPERLGEKAVYVVNMSADSNARVVADIDLRHE
jgi:hypothetical protein